MKEEEVGVWPSSHSKSYSTRRLSRAELALTPPLGDCLGGWHAYGQGHGVPFTLFPVESFLFCRAGPASFTLIPCLLLDSLSSSQPTLYSVTWEVMGCRTARATAQPGRLPSADGRAVCPRLWGKQLQADNPWCPRTRTGGVSLVQRGVAPPQLRDFFLGKKPSSQCNKRAPMPLGSLGHLLFNAMKASFKASAQGLSFFFVES